MLLRRVIEHVRRQDWAAVGIDFVITVVGVFVGLQAANLNEARVDRIRAHSYLERIHADLEADIQNYERRLTFWSEVASYGRACLDYAEGGRGAETDAWPVLLACFQASQLADYRTTSATYDELKSAGELNLIEDRALRTMLAGYYVYADNPSLSERPIYREHVRGVIPLDVQTHIWAHCFETTTTGEQALIDCASPVSGPRVAQILNAIRAEPRLMQELRYWVSTMEVASRIGRDRISYARQIAAAVQAASAR